MKRPTLTPLEAKQRYDREGGFTHEGFEYYQHDLDESMMASTSVFEFSSSGEIGSPITEQTVWLGEGDL